MVKMILMVAEKPSIAEALARAISPTQQFSKRTGTSSKTPVYEFEGTFPYVGGGREKVWIKVTSTVGHVYKTEFPEKYRKWEDVEIVDLFDAPVEKLEADPRTRMPAHFQEEAAYCSHLVLWLDCDREGENICFEVMKNCCPDATDKWNEARLIPRNNVHRAKFSALDEKSLREAYWELRYSPDQNQSDAVEARQEMDLKVGVAWTRFLTTHFADKYRDLQSKMLSYGPCQSPTLWFCVQRYDEIKTFKPETYHTLQLKIKLSSIFKLKKEKMKMEDPKCLTDKSKGFKKKFDLFNSTFKGTDEFITLDWTKGAVFGDNIVSSFKDMVFEPAAGGEVPAGSKAEAELAKGAADKTKTYQMQLLVTDLSNKTEERSRPQGLDTVTMLKKASENLGIGPKDAMAKAESLYLKGFITYPRTESTAYPRSFDHKAVIGAQKFSSKWGAYAGELFEKGHQRPRPGHDAGDHPPITPTTVPANRAETIADAQTVALYELVCRNYLASVSTNLKYQVKKVTLTIKRDHGEDSVADKMAPAIDFNLSDKFLIDPGFIRVQKKNYDDDAFRREFVEGNSLLNICEDLTIWEQFKMEYCPALDERKFRESGGKVIPHDLMFEVKEEQTKPPGAITESQLLGLMDKHGIGTDASMATHIQTIVDRHYVEIKSGRTLHPTRLGIAMVHGYQLVDYELTLPKIRADMEACCTAVAKGEARRGPVVKHALEIFQKKFEYFSRNIEFMEALWTDEFNQGVEVAPGVGGVKPLVKEGEEGEDGAENALAAGAGTPGDGGEGGKKGRGKKGDGEGEGKKGKGKKGKRDDRWNNDERDDSWKRSPEGEGESGGKKGGGKKGDRRDAKGDGKGGKRLPKQRHELEDSDLTAEDKQLMMEFYPERKKVVPAVFIVTDTKKEKELQKLKKKLRDIEILEKKADEGKALDGLQKKKMMEKEELIEQVEALEAKMAAKAVEN